MKKYISVSIILIVLSIALCVPALASTERIVTLSDDYMELYYNGMTYVRADASMLHYDIYSDETDKYEEYGSYYAECPYPSNYNGLYTIKLSDKQHSEINLVEIIDVNDAETIFYIIIHFNDGSELHIDFLAEKFIDEYRRITSGNTDKFVIDFMWPEGNIAILNKENYYIGNEVTIDAYEYDEEFPVYASSTKGGFEAEVGYIYAVSGRYYFYSFIDAGIKNGDEFYEILENKMKVIELTDKDTISRIEVGVDKYYNDDYGYLYNDELTETVSKIFFIIVFAIAPAVVCIVTLILALKSKKALYKKLLFATCGISILEIVTFIYIAFTLFNN